MKKCPQCGKEYPDANKFCGVCGSKLIDVQVKERQGDYRKHEQAQFAHPVKPAKKKIGLIGKIGIAASAVIAVAAAVLIGSMALRSGGSESAEGIIYASGGHYYFVKDAKKNDAVMIPSSYEDYHRTLQISPNGKYVYYLENYDYSERIGELWRCEYKKLGSNSSKNEKYCEKIASSVMEHFFLPEDDSVVYGTESDGLKYFDGKDTYDLTDIPYFYKIKGEKRVAYISGNKLYGIELQKPEEKILLADDCYTCFDVKDFDHIFYGVLADDDKLAIYVTGFGKEPEKIGLGSYDTYFCDGETAYQVEENGMKVSAVDFLKEEADPELQDALSDALGELRTFKTLYTYKDGKCSVISDKVMYAFKLGDCLVYAKASPLELPDFTGVDKNAVSDYLKYNLDEYLNTSCLFVYSPYSGESMQFTNDSIEDMNEIANSRKLGDDSDSSLIITETDVLYWKNSNIYVGKVQDGKIQEFSQIVDDVSACANKGSVVLYNCNKRTDEKNTYYDVYSYQNGESRQIASGALDGWYICYEDGGTLIETDYETDQGSTYTFTNENGEQYEVCAGYSCSYAGESKFVYQSGEDLWMYENGERNFIAHDVDDYWNLNFMQMSFCSYR